MVMINERTSMQSFLPVHGIHGGLQRRSVSMGVHMGDGRDSPRSSPSYHAGWQQHLSRSFSEPRLHSKRRSFSFTQDPGRRGTLLKAVYLMAFISWLATSKIFKDGANMMETLQLVGHQLQTKSPQKKENVDKIMQQVHELERKAEELHQKKNSLRHEIRMLHEMDEQGIDMHHEPSNQVMMEGFIANWMKQRKKGLVQKINVLEQYLKDVSSSTVTAKYGAGPYRVQFRVQIATETREPAKYEDRNVVSSSEMSVNRRSTVTRSFVVELASLDLMPHSVHLFLDMIESKIWDNTVFLHHEKSEHVMAAAPMDYKSHNIKSKGLDNLKWKEMGFPEYSSKYPHAKYTLGFANKGPTFYINTMDNSEAHGPGGQGHHLLSGDADPCFGTVVQGTEVVDALISYGLKANNRLKQDGDHPWKDDDHVWSRIVSAKIL